MGLTIALQFQTTCETCRTATPWMAPPVTDLADLTRRQGWSAWQVVKARTWVSPSPATSPSTSESVSRQSSPLWCWQCGPCTAFHAGPPASALKAPGRGVIRDRAGALQSAFTSPWSVFSTRVIGKVTCDVCGVVGLDAAESVHGASNDRSRRAIVRRWIRDLLARGWWSVLRSTVSPELESSDSSTSSRAKFRSFDSRLHWECSPCTMARWQSHALLRRLRGPVRDAAWVSRGAEVIERQLHECVHGKALPFLDTLYLPPTWPTHATWKAYNMIPGSLSATHLLSFSGLPGGRKGKLPEVCHDDALCQATIGCESSLLGFALRRWAYFEAAIAMSRVKAVSWDMPISDPLADLRYNFELMHLLQMPHAVSVDRLGGKLRSKGMLEFPLEYPSYPPPELDEQQKARMLQ